MFGSTALEIAIGLTTVYLIISLIVTSINELLAGLSGARAKNLEYGIRSLLNDREGSITGRLFAHPLIRSLSPIKAGMRTSSGPSYIPSATFAKVLLDLLGGPDVVAARHASNEPTPDNAKIDPPKPFSVTPRDLSQALAVLLEGAGADVHEIQLRIEQWFDNGMERVSGWYKRKTQVVILMISLATAILLNADTLKIAHALAVTPTLRSVLAAEGQKIAATRPTAESPEAVARTYDELSALGLPLGWTGESAADFHTQAGAFDLLRTGQHITGWFITAVAVSLGAPFWFDLLNRFINIRSAGRPPGDAPRPPRKTPPARAEGDRA